MGELVFQAYVARGIDIVVRAPEMLIDLHPRADVELHSRVFQPQAFDVRRPAYGY